MILKRSIYILLLLLVLWLALSISIPTRPLSAQGPTPTMTPTADMLNAQDVLKAAQQASADAAVANNNANNVVNNANNAVNTVNLLLNFIQAASLFGGVLASVTAVIATRSGLRTLNYYREELTKARVDLDEMRSNINKESQQVRTQVENSIRALTLMQLGEQQIEMHNVKGALRMYQQAYELDPTNRASNYFLGELYIQDKQLEEGIAHLENTLKENSDYAPAEAALGYALRLKADQIADGNQHDKLYAQAEARFLKALETDPSVLDVNGESVQAVLGGLYKRQGQTDRAIYRYEEARKVTPQKSYPVVNLALLYFARGNLDEARRYFELSEEMSTRTLEVNPYDYWARLDRLTAALVFGKIDSALSDLAVVLQQIKTAFPLETALNELMRMQNAPKPLKDIDQVTQQMQEAIDRIKIANPPHKPSA